MSAAKFLLAALDAGICVTRGPDGRLVAWASDQQTLDLWLPAIRKRRPAIREALAEMSSRCLASSLGWDPASARDQPSATKPPKGAHDGRR